MYLRDIAQTCRACFLALMEMRKATIFFLRTRINRNGAVEYMLDEKMKSILTIASLAIVVIFHCRLQR